MSWYSRTIMPTNMDALSHDWHKCTLTDPPSACVRCCQEPPRLRASESWGWDPVTAPIPRSTCERNERDGATNLSKNTEDEDCGVPARRPDGI